MDLNVIKFLESLSELYLLSNDNGRSLAFKKAAESLKNKQLKYIGKSVLSEISEFQSTGTSKRYNELYDSIYGNTDKENVINLFKTVYGIKEKALIYYDQGARNLSELAKLNIPESSKNYIKYYSDLQERIPRSEMDIYYNFFMSIFKHYNLEADMLGSYRRGLEDSGDIDIIVNNTYYSTDFMLEILKSQNILTYTLAHGVVRIFCIIKFPGFKYRRFDLMLAEPSKYPFVLLHSTGSAKFNIMMSEHAQSIGYKLSKEGLLNLSTNQYVENILSEKDIFSFLNLEYKEPSDRNL